MGREGNLTRAFVQALRGACCTGMKAVELLTKCEMRDAEFLENVWEMKDVEFLKIFVKQRQDTFQKLRQFSECHTSLPRALTSQNHLSEKDCTSLHCNHARLTFLRIQHISSSSSYQHFAGYNYASLHLSSAAKTGNGQNLIRLYIFPPLTFISLRQRPTTSSHGGMAAT
eukprot:4991839-Amphidinium_carterae.1